MLSRNIRQRINQNYIQTFHFSDTNNIDNVKDNHNQECQINHQNICSYHKVCHKCSHRQNIIDHPILRSDTLEQIRDKKVLKGESNSESKPQIITFAPKKISQQRKSKDLRGQLQEGGVNFFFRRPQIQKNEEKQKLIPTDCKFNHTCYGNGSTMNQFCNYPKRNLDWILKQNYDFKHQLTEKKGRGIVYVFKQKEKQKKK